MLLMSSLLKIDLQLSQKEYEYLMELLINSAKEDLENFLRYDFMYHPLEDQAIACDNTSNAINIMKQINESVQSSVSDVGFKSVLEFFMKKDEELFNFVNEEEMTRRELQKKSDEEHFNKRNKEHVQP